MMGQGDELVLRAQRGDPAAWHELYGDHADRLVVWLRRLRPRDPATDAEDLAAEAWLTAARRVGDFRGDRCDFGGWLFGIARNVARSRCRARRATTPLGPEVVELVADGVVDPAVGVAGDDLARRLVAVLPAREAQVVACLDVVGLDVAATSEALEISPTAVRVAHHRGLCRLRRLLVDVTLEPRTGM